MAERHLARPVGYAAVSVLVLTGATWLALHRAAPAPPATNPTATTTAAVTRTTVAAHTIVVGTLGYLGPVAVVAVAGPGVLTALPAIGATIGPDQRLYEVDGRAVLLWTGARPAWRDFAPGMSDGPDVAQLEQNLVMLGHGRDLTVDNHFSATTAAAVRRWQAAHGLPQTGRVPLGQVVFLPGAVRISAVHRSIGAPLQPGADVLTATSTAKAVTVNLDPGRQGEVHPGEHVTITLPAGAGNTTGTVTAVSAPTAGGAGGASNGAGGAGPNGGQTVSGPALSLPVTIGLDDPAAAGGLNAGTVQVSITTAEHDDVLAVPINALLAAPGGGYQVAVVTGGQRRLLPVRTGLFDETGGLVEVGGEVQAGMLVEVPAS